MEYNIEVSTKINLIRVVKDNVTESGKVLFTANSTLDEFLDAACGTDKGLEVLADVVVSLCETVTYFHHAGETARAKFAAGMLAQIYCIA